MYSITLRHQHVNSGPALADVFRWSVATTFRSSSLNLRLHRYPGLARHFARILEGLLRPLQRKLSPYDPVEGRQRRREGRSEVPWMIVNERADDDQPVADDRG